MRVYRGGPREARLGKAKMRGFPHSDDPEKAVKGEPWAGVTPSGRSPMTWIPMKRGPEGSEAKGRGLGIKRSQAKRNPNPVKSLQDLDYASET